MLGALALVGPAGIPRGYRLVSESIVNHPVDGGMGALLQVESSGVYVMYIAGCAQSCPQDWARGVDAGQRIKAARKAAGLTQTQLAQSADISLRLEQKYESGETSYLKASADTAVRLAAGLNTTVEALINGR